MAVPSVVASEQDDDPSRSVEPSVIASPRLTRRAQPRRCGPQRKVRGVVAGERKKLACMSGVPPTGIARR
jgi:hypothetical protein